MASYDQDRRWSDKFIPNIKRIVGPLLLQIAPLDIDTSEATDLIVLRARDMRIGARIRRPDVFDKYASEFTIRSRRDSGAKTELSKIVDGWGDWLFYGHAEESELPCIEEWMLVDLHSFRAALIRNNNNGVKLRFGDKANGDGTFFRWFDVRSFPPQPEILVASSHSITQRITTKRQLPLDGWPGPT